MDRYHADTSFLNFSGRRINISQSTLPASPEVRKAHDRAHDDRDAVLRSLIGTQRTLEAAIETIHIQDRMIAGLSSSQYEVNTRFGGKHEMEWIGFRLFTQESGPYNHDIGFHSRGRPTSSRGNIWKEDMFIKHVEGKHAFPLTEYISVSDTPGRLLSLPASKKDDDYEVAVIDLKKLRRVGQVVERTTDVNNYWQSRDTLTMSHPLIYWSTL